MSQTTAGKIQNLLEQAARQNDSAAADDSSVAGGKRVLPSADEAEEVFSRLHEKLFHIEHWNSCSEISSFELFSANGIASPEKAAALGDFIKITLPGSGKGDWVKITAIDESAEETILTVQPSHNPTDEKDEKTTSHFFADTSTNNFCLQKDETTINFYVIGLNEETNTEETSGVLETVRNYATANLGCLLGIQKVQWETFCRNFLEAGDKK